MSSHGSSVSEAESQALDTLLTLSRQPTRSTGKRSAVNRSDVSTAPDQSTSCATLQDGRASCHTSMSKCDRDNAKGPALKRSMMEPPGSTEHSGSSMGSEDATKLRSTGEDSNTSASPTSSTDAANTTATSGTSNDSSSHRDSGSSSSASDSIDGNDARRTKTHAQSKVGPGIELDLQHFFSTPRFAYRQHTL
jgi:hypothetical protein